MDLTTRRSHRPRPVIRRRAAGVVLALTTLATAACTATAPRPVIDDAPPQVAGSGTGTGSVDALPRIPWDGGPAYYAKFPAAAARGWTDPGFFPISVWFESVITPQDVAMDKEIGLNTYLALTADSDLSLVRDNGMSAIIGSPDMPGVGSETVGWLLGDEPEQFGHDKVVSYLDDQVAKIRKKDPSGSHFLYTNFTGNMVFPIYTPGADLAATWLDIDQVSSIDVYWYTSQALCSGSISGEVWKDGGGSPQTNGSGFNNLSPAECHRSSNYGYLVDRVREIDGSDGSRQPIFAFVENGKPLDATDPTITPDQMAGAVWNSLIHGARGINYFNHSFSGDCASSHNFRDPVLNARACYAGIRDRAKQVNGQIKQLAPVLNTQSFAYTFDPRLDTMLKKLGDSYYIFAMPSGVKGGSATGHHTLQLPPGMAGSSAEVLFENRTVPIGGNRQLTDDFAGEFTYHIYKITP